jgi:hypothetical protein
LARSARLKIGSRSTGGNFGASVRRQNLKRQQRCGSPTARRFLSDARWPNLPTTAAVLVTALTGPVQAALGEQLEARAIVLLRRHLEALTTGYLIALARPRSKRASVTDMPRAAASGGD